MHKGNAHCRLQFCVGDSHAILHVPPEQCPIDMALGAQLQKEEEGLRLSQSQQDPLPTAFIPVMQQEAEEGYEDKGWSAVGGEE